MKTNVKKVVTPVFTHEGAKASSNIGALNQLKRLTSSCLLWENEFYVDGKGISDQVKIAVGKCSAEDVSNLAIDLRTNGNLRHMPLFLARELARNTNGNVVGKTISGVIQRADEMAEFLSIYWKDKKQPLSKQVKIGLANAFDKFTEYNLAKYNRDGAIKMRDVLFLCHAKPKNELKAKLYKKIVDNKLDAPDTWEVALSAGADKKETFIRLINDKKLGGLALLRNLRNMVDSGVDRSIISKALSETNFDRVLPFRFIAAARACPSMEPELDKVMQTVLTANKDKLNGKTILLVDVSGSMDVKLSAKSDLSRLDTACALGILLAGISDNLEVYTFSNSIVQVPARKGMALSDAIIRSQSHGGTDLANAIKKINTMTYDRLIVITYEQTQTVPSKPNGKSYLINVASNQNGISYNSSWKRIDGFSENVVKWIYETEKDVE